MVTFSTTSSTQRCSQIPRRPPSPRSDSDRAPPKTREASSRHLSLSTSSSSSNSSSSTNTTSSSGSPIPSRRSRSPAVIRSINTPLSSVKERAVSTERRRPAAAAKTPSKAERMLTTSVRNLFASFQGEQFPIPANRVNQTENSKPRGQQHRWPQTIRGQNSNILTGSLDWGAQRGNELNVSKKKNRTGDENTGNNNPSKIVVPVVYQGLKQRDPASKPIVANKFQNEKSRVSPSLRPGARTRNGVGDNKMCCTPTMLGFAAVVSRKNLGENRIFDARGLRLLHNRQLQWRLVNARAENALSLQKQAAERNLYNTWVSTSKLRSSVMSKRAELQLLRHNLKLCIVLKEQVLRLEDWGIIEKDHFKSLTGIIKAMEASTIRLPIVNGARADVKNVQVAISSAVNVMQSIASSTHHLLTKVEQTSSLVSNLSNTSVREVDLLDETRDFLSTAIIPFQVKYCSLKAHALQIQATL